MTDTPTLAEALKLAGQGGPDWELLLARMESPRPWKHDEKIDGANVMIGGGIQNYRCIKCGRQSHRWQGAVDDPVIPYCSFPDPVTEPLPCIVNRKMREMQFDNRVGAAMGRSSGFQRRWDSALIAVFGSLWTFTIWFRATPAQQLVCLWAAEGRLAE